jgi:hypothetical protein
MNPCDNPSLLTLVHEAYRDAVACHVQVLLVPCLLLCFGLPSNCDTIFWHHISHQKHPLSRNYIFYSAFTDIKRLNWDCLVSKAYIYQNHVLSFFFSRLEWLLCKKRQAWWMKKHYFRILYLTHIMYLVCDCVCHTRVAIASPLPSLPSFRWRQSALRWKHQIAQLSDTRNFFCLVCCQYPIGDTFGLWVM